MSSFDRQLFRFIKKAKGNADAAFRGVVVELFSSVILDTPVDEGRARANWQVTERAPAEGEVERDDPSGSAAVGAVQKFSYKFGQTIYLTNNLPYIYRLEYEGWSKQAPEGMVRKNMARVESILRKATAGLA